MKRTCIFLMVLFSVNQLFAQETVSAISDAFSLTIGKAKIGGNADVDKDIPETGKVQSHVFAWVVGNEDYSSAQTDLNTESNVDFAENDARVFNEYLLKTLGVPEKNITLDVNATAATMRRSLNKITKLADAMGGSAEIIVYYAGHGFPDERTQEAFLIPVDVSGTDLDFAIKLKDMYAKLTTSKAKRVTVFLDACFSGGARNQGLIAARAVKVKPKNEKVNGNLIVFSASSGEQSSLPYKEKEHGMFTYYLLKKLQKSKGKVNYDELSEYLERNVKLDAIRVNNKEQHPQTIVSPYVGTNWKDWEF